MDNQQGKVLSFPKGNYAVFSPVLRKNLESGVAPMTDKPSEVVTAVEQIICTTLVSAVRLAAQSIGEMIGNKIIGAASSAGVKKFK